MECLQRDVRSVDMDCLQMSVHDGNAIVSLLSSIAINAHWPRLFGLVRQDFGIQVE